MDKLVENVGIDFFANQLATTTSLNCSELDRKGLIKNQKTYQDVYGAASLLADEMRRLGWSGHRVLLALPNGLPFMEVIAACILAGVTPIPVSLPRSVSQSVRLQYIVQDADANAVLVLNQAAVDKLEPVLPNRVVSLDALQSNSLSPWSQQTAVGNNTAFIQYTSGSTSDPKGVQISFDNLTANVDLIAKTLQLNSDDVAVTWLPMFHDFGLVGFVYTVLRYPINWICMDPMSFIQKPLRWLQAMNDYQATVTGAPNFGYESICKRVAAEDIEGLDLSHWRAAFNGAEPINAQTLQAFEQKLTGTGFNRSAFLPCYGMAEATLFVSGSRVGEGYHLKKMSVTGNEPVQNQTPELELVSSGYLNDDVSVIIVDPKNSQATLAEGQVGEIAISGDSVFSGYIGQSTAQQNNRVNLEQQSYFLTGDLGLIEAGQLYVLGRKKDLIIIRGRNVYPNDIEIALADIIPNKKPNSVVAFGINHNRQEQLVVLVEMKHDSLDAESNKQLEQQARRIITEQHQLAIDHLVFCKPNTLLKTSSGKLRRSSCRDLYLKPLLSR